MKYPIIVKKHINGKFTISVIDYPNIVISNESYDLCMEIIKDELEAVTWTDSSNNKLKLPSIIESINEVNQDSFLSQIEIADRYLKLPKVLYYYLPVSEILFNMLSKPYIWFSNPVSFNDPFELPNVFIEEWTPHQEWLDFEYAFTTLKHKFDVFKPYNSAQDAYIHLKFNAINTLKDVIKLKTSSLDQAMSELKVSCFSRNYDNSLMWSHYARKHTGVVIGYSTEMLLDEKRGIFGSDIDYRLKTRKLNAGEYAGSIQDILKSEYNAIKLFTKHPSWSYEQEFRLVSLDKQDGQYPIDKSSIKELYFGCRMKETTKSSLLALIKGLDLQVDVFHMEKLENELRKKPA